MQRVEQPFQTTDGITLKTQRTLANTVTPLHHNEPTNERRQTSAVLALEIGMA